MCCQLWGPKQAACCLHTAYRQAEQGRRVCRQRQSTQDGKELEGRPRPGHARVRRICRAGGTLMGRAVAGSVREHRGQTRPAA